MVAQPTKTVVVVLVVVVVGVVVVGGMVVVVAEVDVVVLVAGPWTKASETPFVSAGTRLEAPEANATNEPSLLSWRKSGLGPFASPPELSTLARSVSPVARWWTKMSVEAFVSLGTRFVAKEKKAIVFPSSLMEGAPLSEFPCPPALSTLTSSVLPVVRSWTKTSFAPLLSFGTRFEEREVNATKRPSPLIEGSRLSEFPSLPELSTLTRSVVPVSRSWTKTSKAPFVSFGTRFEEVELNVTKRPSSLMDPMELPPFPSAPELSTLTRSVVPVKRSWTKASDWPFMSPGTNPEA